MDDITPRTRLLAGAAIAAPLLLLASTVTYLAGDGLGDDPAGGAIQVYAAVAFGLAIIGLTARIEPHLPRLATALTVTGMVGVAGAVGFGQDSIVYSYNPLAALSEHESVAAGVALFFPGVVFPATLAGLGLAAARTRSPPGGPGPSSPPAPCASPCHASARSVRWLWRPTCSSPADWCPSACPPSAGTPLRCGPFAPGGWRHEAPPPCRGHGRGRSPGPARMRGRQRQRRRPVHRRRRQHDPGQAVDYAFQGVPPSVKAGSRFTLTNASAVEVHELVAVRLPDDEKRVAVDILKDPASRGALFASGPPAAVIVAAPSSAMPGAVQGDGTLTRPGRYLFLCSIPTGADPGAYLEAAKTATGPVQVAGGPPHSAKGMVAEVTVTS